MTSRICAPNLRTNPEVVEGMAVQSYWYGVGLGDRTMVGWWDDAPLVTTGDDEVKATAWLRANATAATPRTVIALGNFRNQSVNVSHSGGPADSAMALTAAEGAAGVAGTRWRARGSRSPPSAAGCSRAWTTTVINRLSVLVSVFRMFSVSSIQRQW